MVLQKKKQPLIKSVHGNEIFALKVSRLRYPDINYSISGWKDSTNTSNYRQQDIFKPG